MTLPDLKKVLRRGDGIDMQWENGAEIRLVEPQGDLTLITYRYPDDSEVEETSSKSLNDAAITILDGYYRYQNKMRHDSYELEWEPVEDILTD